MSIVVSYERSDELDFEAVVFIDDESGDCWQIQHDLADPTGVYGVSTGAGAPAVAPVVEWALEGGDFRFVLTPRAARLFGGEQVLEFAAEPGDGNLDAVAAHLRRIIGA